MLTVNDIEYVILTEAEIAQDNIWRLATIRAFTIVNIVLREVESDERVYWLYGDNDNHAVFLTDALYEAIRQSGVLSSHEMPEPVLDRW